MPTTTWLCFKKKKKGIPKKAFRMFRKRSENQHLHKFIIHFKMTFSEVTEQKQIKCPIRFHSRDYILLYVFDSNLLTAKIRVALLKQIMNPEYCFQI